MTPKSASQLIGFGVQGLDAIGGVRRGGVGGLGGLGSQGRCKVKGSELQGVWRGFVSASDLRSGSGS